MSKVWKIVKRMKGNFKEPLNHVKNGNGDLEETKNGIVNCIGEAISSGSSSSNYSADFQQHKLESERKNVNFDSTGSEKYNEPFSMNELKTCISELKSSAPGKDGIHNHLITHLPEISLELLLYLFNNLWETNCFPDTWCKALVIPIPKPGKDHTNPSNYRPIALTSCLCKLMEKMVNKRLMWFLEKNKILNNIQSGFRKNRSTVDQLVRLETFIRNAFIKKEHVTAIFFDLEKAFDTTWKHGILKDLHSFGLRGNLPKFIMNFLNNRSYEVRVGSDLSNPFFQEEGVPQGSVLSPILFEIKINSITKILQSGIDCSLYVDDFLICYKSKNIIGTIDRQLNLQLKKIEDWANKNGFKFSNTKTKALHFCRKTSCVQKHALKINKEYISNVIETKFLGLIFDKKLTFLPHIKDLKKRCTLALNAFKVMSNPEWGGDTEILLNLYRSLIRSKLDYASFIYGGAAKTNLELLNPIQNQGLRLALGAFRTSPETSLHAEAYELPMELRRKKLGIQYAIKISSTPDNPVFNSIFGVPKDVTSLALTKPSFIKPFGLRIEEDLSKLDFSHRNTENFSLPRVPPWKLASPKFNFEGAEFPKGNTHPSKYMDVYIKLRQSHEDSTVIFTDGSKTDTHVGSAAICGTPHHREKKERLNLDSSIFTAEAHAINLALDIAKETKSDSILMFRLLISSKISKVK